MQMITKALYGRLPLQLPATLETIIDGSVKKFIDLQPVKEWVAKGALAIVNHLNRQITQSQLHDTAVYLDTNVMAGRTGDAALCICSHLDR